MNKKNGIYLLLKSVMKPYLLKMSIVFITSISTSLLLLTIPIFLKKVTELLNNSHGSMEGINHLLLLLGAVFLLQAVFTFISDYYTQLIGEKMTLELRESFFEKIINLPLSFYAIHPASELSARLTDDITAIRRVVTGNLVQLIKNILIISIVIIILFIISPLLTLVTFASVSLIGIGGTFALNNIKMLSVNIQKKHSNLLGYANESLNNIPIIKAFVRENFILKKYRRLSNEVLKLVLKRSKLIAIIKPVANLIGFIAIGISFWFALNKVVVGDIEAGDLIAYLGYAFILASAISQLSSNLGSINKESGTIKKLMDFINFKEERSQNNFDRTLPVTNLDIGNINFNNIKFSYNNSENLVLKNMSFEIKHGSKVAIVGPSGAGKSTIINLLLKNLNPQYGNISIGNTNIQDVSAEVLRENIGVVLQDTYLFNTSIYENIRFGNPEASEVEIFAAAKAANVDQFVKNFPYKYETYIGERGNKLSRGQAQRIAIARMILKDPQIVILDEATASLDNQNEGLVYLAINKIMENRTTIMITHKLNTLHNIDNIFVLFNGNIIETGTPEKLMESKGFYYEMYNTQLDKDNLVTLQ